MTPLAYHSSPHPESLEFALNEHDDEADEKRDLNQNDITMITTRLSNKHARAHADTEVVLCPLHLKQ